MGAQTARSALIPNYPQSSVAPLKLSTSSLERNLYLDLADMQEAPSVRPLHQRLPPVTFTTLSSEVLNLFLDDASLYAVPVVDVDGIPSGLIERYSFIEYFSRQYSIDIFGKKPLLQLSEIEAVVNKKPIVVDAATSIDDVAAIIINAGMQHMVSGFIVTDQNGTKLRCFSSDLV